MKRAQRVRSTVYWTDFRFYVYAAAFAIGAGSVALAAAWLEENIWHGFSVLVLVAGLGGIQAVGFLVWLGISDLWRWWRARPLDVMSRHPALFDFLEPLALATSGIVLLKTGVLGGVGWLLVVSGGIWLYICIEKQREIRKAVDSQVRAARDYDISSERSRERVRPFELASHDEEFAATRASLDESLSDEQATTTETVEEEASHINDPSEMPRRGVLATAGAAIAFVARATLILAITFSPMILCSIIGCPDEHEEADDVDAFEVIDCETVVCEADADFVMLPEADNTR